jgi:hypothetical protein
MRLGIIYKVRTVPTEGGHPERPEPSKPGRGHKYATPVSRRTIRAARMGSGILYQMLGARAWLLFGMAKGSPGVLLDSHGGLETGGFHCFGMVPV